MIAINALYGVLLGEIGAAALSRTYEWYRKKYTTSHTTDKIEKIVEILCKNVTPEQRVMFACLVCTAVLKTIFGKEIAELDPVNTYVPVSRPPNSDNSDSDFCLFMLTGPSDMFKPLMQFLDDDIKRRLTAPTWMEYVAAGCLQILRELKK
jgi:hypothetical protein